MNTDDLLLSDGGTNAGPGKKTDKKRGGKKAWTTETKTEEEIKTEAEAVPETEARTESKAVSKTEARTKAEAVSETETRTDTEAEAESKNKKKTNSEEKFSVLSLKEEKLRDKRLNKICRLADRVVDRLTGAVEELETDVYKRQATILRPPYVYSVLRFAFPDSSLSVTDKGSDSPLYASSALLPPGYVIFVRFPPLYVYVTEVPSGAVTDTR